MTRLDGELSPSFEIVEPEQLRAPIIFNSPHSGSVYPEAFLSASRIDLATLRRSEDSFMDELIGDLSTRGFPVVRVNFPRSYVDVNREPYELDPRMFNGRLPSFANTRSMRVAGGLGTIPREWAGETARAYLADIRETDPIYRSESLGHPGLLQRVMNKVLVDNAVLGPWIHVGSRMQLLSVARTGDELTARAKVVGNYEKKGHRFVELDALVVANGTTALAHCWHIAIYQPREQAAA